MMMRKTRMVARLYGDFNVLCSLSSTFIFVFCMCNVGRAFVLFLCCHLLTQAYHFVCCLCMCMRKEKSKREKEQNEWKEQKEQKERG